MECTFTKDNEIISPETQLKKPSLEEVKKREEERVKNTNEEGKPKEGVYLISFMKKVFEKLTHVWFFLL